MLKAARRNAVALRKCIIAAEVVSVVVRAVLWDGIISRG